MCYYSSKKLILHSRQRPLQRSKNGQNAENKWAQKKQTPAGTSATKLLYLRFWECYSRDGTKSVRARARALASRQCLWMQTVAQCFSQSFPSSQEPLWLTSLLLSECCCWNVAVRLCALQYYQLPAFSVKTEMGLKWNVFMKANYELCNACMHLVFKYGSQSKIYSNANDLFCLTLRTEDAGDILPTPQHLCRTQYHRQLWEALWEAHQASG